VPIGEFPGPYSYGYDQELPPSCKRLFWLAIGRSFFGNLQSLYFVVPAQSGYGDKWPSQ